MIEVAEVEIVMDAILSRRDLPIAERMRLVLQYLQTIGPHRIVSGERHVHENENRERPSA